MRVSMLKKTSNAFEAFKKFNIRCLRMHVEREKTLKIRCLRIERRGELNSKVFFCNFVFQKESRELSTPSSPQQNGIVERRIDPFSMWLEL